MNHGRATLEPTSSPGGRLGEFLTTRFGIALAIVALLTTAVLAPALSGPFLWDDESLIVENRTIHEFSHWTEWFRTSLFSERTQQLADQSSVQYWRPVPLATFALDWWLGGNNPALFHATNLLLYFVLVLMVGWTLRRYTGNASAALLAVILYALHPTHVECAAWISGRMDLLAANAILLSIWSLGRRIHGRRGFVWLELSSAVFAYLSKETALLLPVFAFVEAFHARNAPRWSTPAIKRLALDIAPQLGLGAAYLSWRCFGLSPSIDLGANVPALSVSNRLGVSLETIGRASSLSVVPFPQRAQQGLFALDPSGNIRLDTLYVMIGTASVLAIAIAAVACRRRSNALLALLLTVISFVPSANLVAPGLLSCFTFERYLLLPHFGGVLCIALVTSHLLRDPNSRHGCVRRACWLASASLAVPLFGWRAQERAEDYSDRDRFWRHELAHNPLSSLAPSQLSALSDTPRASLNWLHICHANAAQRGQFDDADRCLLVALETLTNALPDARINELGRLARELTSFLNDGPSGDAPSSPITHGIALTLPSQGERRARILTWRPGRIESDLAVIHSRMGDHTHALRLADTALSRCQRCRWSLPLATVFAAAGQHQRARELLQTFSQGTPDLDRASRQILESEGHYQRAQRTAGPQRLHALAHSYLSIGRFGLALATLQGEEAAIIQTKEAALDYALLAFRAGHTDVARRALVRHAAPDAVNRIIIEWQKEQPSL